MALKDVHESEDGSSNVDNHEDGPGGHPKNLLSVLGQAKVEDEDGRLCGHKSRILFIPHVSGLWITRDKAKHVRIGWKRHIHTSLILLGPDYRYSRHDGLDHVLWPWQW